MFLGLEGTSCSCMMYSTPPSKSLYQNTNITKVQGDYLFYFQIPVHHGCFVLQNSNYASLTTSAAMPRLVMCARAAFQAPSLLLSALEMKQFPYHGCRYRITRIQRMKRRSILWWNSDNRQPRGSSDYIYYSFACKHYGTGESNLSVSEMMSSSWTEALDAICAEYWRNE